MYPHILSSDQQELLTLIKSFSKMGYYLAGGTAIALQIGHRRSIDFDMFIRQGFDQSAIEKELSNQRHEFITRYADKDQLTGTINSVQLTFYEYPFDIVATESYEDISMPSLLTLAAMKAYALGRRAKWKDYVDICFILKDYHSLTEVEAEAESIFGSLFNAKLLREQLIYFEDVNYSEKIDYIGNQIPDDEIKSSLVSIVSQQKI